MNTVFNSILVIVLCFGSTSGLKLNLTIECAGSHVYFCTLADLPTSADNPLTIVNSSAPQLSELVIRNSFVSWIPRKIFGMSPNLRGFLMHECNLIRLHSEDFTHAKQLLKLVLQNNRLSELPEKIFAGASGLEELHLANNQIHLLHNKAFAALQKLQYLDLHSNSLHELPHNLFTDLLNLEHLDLSDNNIDRIDNETFAKNLKLQTLLLSNNKFSVFASDALEHLPHLHLLDISYSELDELILTSVDTLLVQSSSLRRCSIKQGVIKMRANNNQLENLKIGDKLAVKELELHSNLFESLEDFIAMLNLQKLDVSKNKLKSLRTSRSPLYLPLPSLIHLNIASNLLQNLSADFFLLLPKLSHLDIAFNHLLHLDQSVFEPLQRLEKLYIEGNRLHRFDYEQLVRTHEHLKELGLFSNDWEFPYMRAMISFLKDWGIYLPVRFNSNEVSESLQLGDHHAAKFNGDSDSNHHRYASTEVSHSREVSGIHPYWTTRDVLTLITLLFVLLILLLQLYHILQEENCLAACRSRLGVRRGARHTVVPGQNRPRRLTEEDSEV